MGTPVSRRTFALDPPSGAWALATSSSLIGRNEVTVLSRRGIADALRTVSGPNDRALPVAIQERVTRMERQSYGINRVAVVLDDGAEQRGVREAWATEDVGGGRVRPSSV